MRVKMARGILVAVFGAALMIPMAQNTAQAHERYGYGERKSYGAVPAAHGVYKQPRHDKRGYRRGKYSKPHRRWQRSKQYSYRQWGRQCRPVSKVSNDGYGNRLTVGGTLCLDRYGQPYIVPGSRYIIN